ncbi:DUF5076 domain-containing protein [Thermomonas brevis]|jgi:hypothetical protein
MKPLVVPPAAQRDPNSVQVLSAWIAEKQQHCTLKIGMWHDMGRDEPRAWGIFLADTVRHIANALQEQHGVSASDSISAILESLHDELADPTSPATGEFSHGHS